MSVESEKTVKLVKKLLSEKKLIKFKLIIIVFIVIGGIFATTVSVFNKDALKRLDIDYSELLQLQGEECELCKEFNLKTCEEENSCIKAKVTKVIDGDTIRIKDYNVRYIGINTPEIKHSGVGKSQRYGKEATEFNSVLVLDKYVYLFKDVSETDKYGRLLRYVFLENGLCVNWVIARKGYANVMTIQPDVKLQSDIKGAVAKAKEEVVGMWHPVYKD